MIAVRDRRDGWVGPNFLTRLDYERAFWLECSFFFETEMALFSECRLNCAQNLLDTADIVREGICRRQDEHRNEQ